MDMNLENLKRLLSLSSDSVKRNVTGHVNLFKKIKWKKISFVIPDVPDPSHRPRLCGYRVYVPGAAKHQSFFNRNVLPKLHGLFISTPCKVDVDIFVPTPKSFTKTQQILAEMKLLRPWVNTGDVDNFLKSVLDQMQPNEKRGHVGIMSNDCLVISSRADKYYSASPRYEVTISYMVNVPDEIKKAFKLNHDDKL